MLRVSARMAWLGVLIAFGAACSSMSKKTVEEVQPAAPLKPTQLSRDEAILRATQIANVSYNLWFGLDGENPDFEGRVVINFELRNRPKDLARGTFLDFEGGKIQALKLNGNVLEVNPTRYDSKRIHFPGKELQPGMNRAEITFSRAYAEGGAGLNRFADPADGQVYIFSNINPYGAYRVFPCFDQPDLRASFELTVETPDGWEVVTNTKERDSPRVDGRVSWAFPPSPKLSTAVFALHAGPFEVKQEELEGVPLRVFLRESLKKKVNLKGWFKIAGQGLEFFNAEFGYPYPYSKYDQIFAPGYEGVPISSAGAVVFSENFLSEGSPDEVGTELAFHEISHMWLGNLVTPRWWNSLWFYQSMAELTSLLAREEGTPGLWAQFFLTQKLASYAHEAKGGLKPLELSVNEVGEAQDGVVALGDPRAVPVLKQLRFFAGADEFRDALQRFVIKHALRNASAGDFFKALTEASEKDVTAWRKAWFQAPGMNSVQAQWSCEITEDKKKRQVSRISQFVLLQGVAAGGALLRPHRTQVALFDLKKSGGKPEEIFDVTYSGSMTELRAAVGKPCPDFVFPNYGDQDYVQVILDSISLEFARKNVGRLQDSLTQAAVLSALADSVAVGEWGNDGFSELLLKGLRSAPSGSVQQGVWWAFFVRYARAPSALKFMGDLLKKKAWLSGFTVDEARRMELGAALASAPGMK